MRRTELLQLQQKLAKTFRTFTAKIGSRAETFSYANKCTGGALVDYTDHVILDVILNGLYDTDIRREVLAAQGILEKPLNDITLLPPYSLSLLSRKKGGFTKHRHYPLSSRSGRRGNTPLLPQYLQGLRGRGPRLDQEIPPNKSRLLQGQSPQQSHAPCASPTINAKRTLNNGCPAPTTTHVAYSCPQRGAVPQRPPELLFPCWPENNAKMKAPFVGQKNTSTR